jgi:Flp pilus assembly protein TadB
MPADINAKTLITLVVVAIVTAVVVTVLQVLLLGKANVAITGAVVVPLVVVYTLSARRKKAS